ncbi:GNAT family N-acetyltransferase [Sphingomonas sp. BAUL-RG-20F-R05-02]|uniref:GNAT family N-acetyltransferase n=1 Tax=Sphingomonas sp. BAUL-RG-20F-R05-02 TaxID=2914830 RepID=UPI001F571F49|nr:GNAT family N-acetyltransferase [Sphingomonas sp. BAUL-RG-20F-R05-02]
MGLTGVRATDVATIVTTLEMRARPEVLAKPTSPLRLVQLERPTPDRYRALFRAVGERWLWFSRLVMDDRSLSAIIHDPDVAVFAAVDAAGNDAGMLELDFRRHGECELGYFGLVPDLAGQKLGRWLMAEALGRAWAPSVGRVWVHTCTLDHPSALNFYRASGFTPIARTIETFADPRILGLLPESAGPHVPRLSASASR